MGLVRLLIVGLLVMLAVRAIWRFLVAVVDGATSPRASRSVGPRGGPPAQGVAMVRDPVCGTFVVPGRALTANDGGRVHHFCSEDCRRAFQSGERK